MIFGLGNNASALSFGFAAECCQAGAKARELRGKEAFKMRMKVLLPGRGPGIV